MRPRLLDLFCCAGGAADGYYAAGFDVVGVDINPQPNYPYEFVQHDALTLLWDYSLRGFDAIHASPPCQHYSVASKSHNGRANDHPDLVDVIRRALILLADGRPFVIENVVGAPLRSPVLLCGTMFDGLRVKRHRLFECHGFTLTAPRPCPVKHPLHHTHDKRKAHYGKTDEWTDFVQVTGGGNCSKAAAADALGISRPMTKQELNECIPPAYTERVGAAMLAAIHQAETFDVAA